MIMTRPGLFRERRSAVSVLFATAVIPLLALIGLAIDFGRWSEVNAALNVSANVAALNGAKLATDAMVYGDQNYQTDAQNAAAQWFTAEVGASGSTLLANYPAVTVTQGPNISVTVGFAGTVPSIFGGILFHILTYPVTGSAAAAVTTAPFLNVHILLDDSGSMDIGASNTDIQTMQQLTGCSSIGAIEAGGGGNEAGQDYSAYQCQSGGNKYDGGLTCPFPVPAPTPYTVTPLPPSAVPSPGCAAPSWWNPDPKVWPTPGAWPAKTTWTAGAVCAFACHWDNSKPAGEGNDYWALARSTIGAANQVTLRFDLVKQATNQVINTMQSDDLPIDNLNVGIWTFNHGLNQVYPAPPGGVPTAPYAGDAWSTAIADVGGPPSEAGQPDTGIQPYCCDNGDGSTDFTDSMAKLVSLLPQSGDGTTAQNPREVLFIVTDGMEDYTPSGGSRVNRAVNPSLCTAFKNLGFTVYVVYTPYTPLMNGFYLSTNYPIVEGTGSGTLAYNLQECASSNSDYIAASDATSLNNALQKFLKAAMTAPARFTK
jgi:Flp pilus assembly protein TadG